MIQAHKNPLKQLAPGEHSAVYYSWLYEISKYLSVKIEKERTMKGLLKIIIFALSLLCTSTPAFDTCTVGLRYNAFNGSLYCGDMKLQDAWASAYLSQVPKANELYQQGVKIHRIGKIIGVTGAAAACGLGFIGMVGGVKGLTAPIFIVGGANLVIITPFLISGGSKKRSAAQLYNESIKTSSLVPSIEFGANAFGLSWRF